MKILNYINYNNRRKYFRAIRYKHDKDYVISLNLFNELLDKDYNSFFCLFNLIEIHESLDSLDDLLDKINLLLEDNYHDYNEMLIQKGNVLLIQHQYENALNCFEEVLNNDLNNVWAYLFKCRVLSEYKDLHELDQLACMIKNRDMDYYLSLRLAMFFFDESWLDEALYCIDLSLKKFSKHPWSWFWKGEILKGLNRYDEALDAFNHSLKLEPNNPSAWADKGMVFKALNDYDNALKCFDKCLEIDSNNVPCMVYKAFYYFNLEDYDRAIDYFELALKLDDSDCDIWDNYGVALYYRNRPDDALCAFEKALSLCPNNLKLLNDKLIVLKDLKMWEEVIRCSNNLLALDDSDFAREFKALAMKNLN